MFALRVFAFENPWIRADPASQYVQTCQGTPEDAVGLLSFYWLAGAGAPRGGSGRYLA